MLKLLISHYDPIIRSILIDALSSEGYKVIGLDDVDMIWEHIENIQPEVMLLDSDSDAFGSMNLYWEIKKKYADLPVILYNASGIDAVNRINTAVAGALSNKSTSL